MTLEELRKSRIEDLFLAVLAKDIGWDKAKFVRLKTPEYPNGITALDAMKISVWQAIIENNEPLTEEYKMRIENEVKQQISTSLEEIYYTILLKHGETYIDLVDMKEISEDMKVKELVKFEEYFSKEEYSFEEDEDGPYLDIERKNFEKFIENYKAMISSEE